MRIIYVVLIAVALVMTGCYALSFFSGRPVLDKNSLILTYPVYDCTKDTFVSVTDSVKRDLIEVGHNDFVLWGAVKYASHNMFAKLLVQGDWPGADNQLVVIVPLVHMEGEDLYTFWLFWSIGALDYQRELMYCSGRYHVRVFAGDPLISEQLPLITEQTWYVDNTAPRGTITYVDDIPVRPNIMVTIPYTSLSEVDEEHGFWVEWSDGLTPDDSVQAHNQVQLWCKSILQANQLSAWQPVGYQPSPCNSHWITTDERLVDCDDSLHLVATVQDQWGNGSLKADGAVQAFADGRYVQVVIDTAVIRKM